MAEASRVLIGLVCCLFILSAIPQTSGQEEVDFNQLNLAFDNQFDEWYEVGDTLDINPILTNSGDQITIPNDPSCGTYIIINDLEMNSIFDNSNNCRDQEQQLIIQQMETIDFQSWQWDFTDSSGELVPSGMYSVNLIHSKTEIMSSKDIYFQQDVVFDDSLELILDLTTLGDLEDRDGHHLIGVTLANPTSNEIILPHEDSCRLIYSLNGEEKMLNSCFGENLKLNNWEHSYIDGIFIEKGSLLEGDNLIKITTPGEDLISELIIENNNPIDDNYAQLDEQILVSTSQNIGLESDHISFISYSINLENTDDQLTELTFTDTCKFQMYIIDDRARKIYDTTEQQTCQDIQTSHAIESGEVLTFDLPEWYLEDENKCYIDSGTYTFILEIVQYSVTAIEQFEYSEAYRNPECSEDMIGFESQYTISGDEITSFISLTPSNPTIKINEQCIVSVSITPVGEDIEFDDSINTYCDYQSGNYFELPISDDGIIGSLDFQSTIDIPQLMERDSIELILMAEHSLGDEGVKSHSFTHIYDYTQEVFKIQKWQLEGLWTNIGTGQVECWMISNDENSYLLGESSQLPSWKPQNNWKGDYLVSESKTSNELCQAQFDLGEIEIHSVYSEEKIIIEEQVIVKENDQIQREQVTPEEIAQTAIVIVSTTSMFAILGLFVVNTESLRIPTTAAGLWLLGLIGKTQETTDGRFQRGRLMGYLTANPGCHFRALMAALGMSNGQITHHLRLLEQQELIWRLRDGRLVRYYPLNNSLYPGMSPEQLPIPPLSPDPNSLQGKILSLLDDEHQYGKFPTQAELAIKLEKSQQLISHHLRTLQKFGLVEKRKMGIKNRYKLTKEALFLLETDIEFKD